MFLHLFFAFILFTFFILFGIIKFRIEGVFAMSDSKDVEIVMPDGSIDKVKLVTYLLSDDGLRQYMVYTKSDSQIGRASCRERV